MFIGELAFPQGCDTDFVSYVGCTDEESTSTSCFIACCASGDIVRLVTYILISRIMTTRSSLSIPRKHYSNDRNTQSMYAIYGKPVRKRE